MKFRIGGKFIGTNEEGESVAGKILSFEDDIYIVEWNDIGTHSYSEKEIDGFFWSMNEAKNNPLASIRYVEGTELPEELFTL